MGQDRFGEIQAEFRGRFRDLIDEYLAELTPRNEYEAFPSQFDEWDSEDIDDFLAAEVTGWVVTIERALPHDNTGLAQSFMRVLAPGFQTQTHTGGILRVSATVSGG